MKNPSSTNPWQPCPTGLIRHLARRIEVQRRRKWIGNTSTVLILSAGFLFAGQEYWQAPARRPTPAEVAPLDPATGEVHPLAVPSVVPRPHGSSAPSADPEDKAAIRAVDPL
ncbi:MAG: hypothetical protein MK108_09085 [Mariniblastus sp.]|nr:hypothetical protein [Mariniblastus sp.]